MGWQAGYGPRPGEAPGRAASLPELARGLRARRGMGRGGAVRRARGGTGGRGRARGPVRGRGTDALVGIVRQWAAIESWAAAGKLAALRAMMREDGEGNPLLRRRGDLPDGWDDSLNYEIAAALAMGPVSAGNLAGLAWALGTRLPGIGRLLADGTLTRAKAKLIAATFEPLDEGEAARAEALILSELAGKTYFQVERLAWRAALAVAPDVAERRRSQAERERARVTVFREESGAVGLSGRDLPAAQALSGHASVLARAGQYEASGAFPGQTTSSLQALAYLHLLNGVTAQDAIAFARAASAEPPDGPGRSRTRARPAAAEPTEPTTPMTTADASADTEGHDRDQGTTVTTATTARVQATMVTRVAHPGRGPRSAAVDHSVLPEVTVPLVTLQRRAERPGENRLLGPLDPAMARDLAAAAARSPGSRWEVTIVDDHGYAVGHGIARARRGRRQEPQPPGPASLRAARAGEHHRDRDSPAPAGCRPAALRGTAGRLGTRSPSDQRRVRHVDTDPARRPGTDRAVRRRAHARLRPPLPGQHLRAERPAPPPDPGPGSRVHVPALLPTRP